MDNESSNKRPRVNTGIENLDRILFGGLPQGRICMVSGGAGTGKTTLSCQFLRAGVEAGERVLYVSLLQSREELQDTAESHGWDLHGVDVLELPEQVRQHHSHEQTVFPEAEVELSEAADAIIAEIERVKPKRAVLDSVTELSVLVESPYRLRLQLLRIKHALMHCQCTAIFTSGESLVEHINTLQTIVHGTISLYVDTPNYGGSRRYLSVSNMHGMAFMTGYHDFEIITGGLAIHPRFQSKEIQYASPEIRVVSSNNPELDKLLGGGVEYGTSCLITGTTGVGKSTLASTYVHAAAERGERSLVFCFDEERETFLRRAEGMGMPMRKHLEAGLIELQQINVGAISPGSFFQTIRQEVEHHQTRILVIDSLSGYLYSMPDERDLVMHLHDLLSYLSSHSVATFFTATIQAMVGMATTPEDASYLTDTVVLLRHFEADGEVRRCISVLKKRHGPHERTIREIWMNESGLHVGPPLRHFSGVLTGQPAYHGEKDNLQEGEAGEEDLQQA